MKHTLMQPISKNELHLVLLDMAQGKCLEFDGIIIEFYKHF
jgi:hypothetical protein